MNSHQYRLATQLVDLIPQVFQKWYEHVFALGEDGRVTEDVQDPTGAHPEATSATAMSDRLSVDSVHAHAIAWLPW